MASWTEKRVERLKLFHKEGFSASGIAQKLGPGFTKGMVAGKLRRLQLAAEPVKKPAASRKTVSTSVRPSAPELARRTAAPRQPAPAIVLRKPASLPTPVQVLAPKGIRIFDLREKHCRWQLGHDQPARFFCGAPVVDSCSWCEQHQRIAFPAIGKPTARTEHRRG
jgi:GcrA cell cycle regulator